MRRLLLMMLLAATFSNAASAQETTGTITGSITDQSGAVSQILAQQFDTAAAPQGSAITVGSDASKAQDDPVVGEKRPWVGAARERLFVVPVVNNDVPCH